MSCGMVQGSLSNLCSVGGLSLRCSEVFNSQYASLSFLGQSARPLTHPPKGSALT